MSWMPSCIFISPKFLIIVCSVSGRSSHVSRIHAEFDAGCDYDLTECEPGDLDPHAVASIFKTFLRECEYPLFALLRPYY